MEAKKDPEKIKPPRNPAKTAEKQTKNKNNNNIQYKNIAYYFKPTIPKLVRATCIRVD